MTSDGRVAGPLAGLRVVELASFGPGPHAGMVLGDLGADVVRVERPSPAATETTNPAPTNPTPTNPAASDQTLRNRRSVVADLSDESGRELVLRLTDRADVLIEGLRPGVAERLGVGPDVCLERNPRLVYARITGWGQDGPLAGRAGHDLNYVAVTGVLAAMRRPGAAPAVPLNVVGDYGGGSMLMLVGVLAALWERQRSGLGQIVDAAMIDGVSLLGQLFWSMRHQGRWQDEPGENLLDGSAPFYDVYACADGKYLALGALEPQFYRELIDGLGLAGAQLPDRDDRARWPELRAVFAATIAERTRDQWTHAFAARDACVSPVLTFAEAAQHEQLAARQTITSVAGVPQAAPAPRFSRTPAGPARAPRHPGEDLAAVLRDWGVPPNPTADTTGANTPSVTSGTKI